MGRLSRLTRRIVPTAWRDTVEADLVDEASRRHWRGIRADGWVAWQMLRVGTAFRWRAPHEPASRAGFAARVVIRDAWRALRSSRGVTAFSVLILTAAIAAGTVTFSVVDAVLLRSLPFEDSARLVEVSSRGGGVLSSRESARVMSFIHFDAWRRQADSFDSLAAGSLGPTAELSTGAGVTARTWTWQTTASLFEALRVTPLHGRLFTAENEVVGRNSVAVIGYRTWQEAFGGDPNTIGRSIRLMYRAKDPALITTIVGIMPAGFSFPLDSPADVWIPHASGMSHP